MSASGPTFTSHLVAAGMSRREQRVAVAGMTRVAAGAYADTRDLTPTRIHHLRTEAVLTRLSRVVASYTSAAVLWELPVRTRDLDLVRVSPTSGRLGRPNSRAGYALRGPVVPDEAITTRTGLPTTNALVTVLSCSRLVDPDWGVVIADSAVRGALVTIEDLAVAAQACRSLRGAGRARRLAARCSALSESPGETLLRLRFQRMGIAAREQVVMPSVEGSPRVDFLIDDWLVVEFDGRAKYAIGGDIEQAHWEEKMRHDRLVEAGYWVLRVIWSQLGDEAALRRRVFGALERGESRGRGRGRGRGVLP